MSIIRSTSTDQDEILRGILALHGIETFEADLTYGNGSFYRSIPQPRLRFDIDPQCDGVTLASSVALPLADASITSAVFDPPFLTYVRAGREGNGNMAMARRFGGYWTYGELTEHYRDTFKEASRVLADGGLFVVKCQDIVHNHRLHPTHVNVIAWATECGFRLDDLFVLTANHRLPSPNRRGQQRHARIHHSYFLVFTRAKGRP